MNNHNNNDLIFSKGAVFIIGYELDRQEVKDKTQKLKYEGVMKHEFIMVFHKKMTEGFFSWRVSHIA